MAVTRRSRCMGKPVMFIGRGGWKRLAPASGGRTVRIGDAWPWTPELSSEQEARGFLIWLAARLRSENSRYPIHSSCENPSRCLPESRS